MDQAHSRRGFAIMTSMLFGGIAGCTTFFDERRTISIGVLNPMDEPVNVRTTIYKEEAVLAEQEVGLVGNSDPDRINPGSFTYITIDDIAEGDELTAEIAVNENRTETVEQTIDCDTAGDEFTFRIYEDHIRTSTGCTTKNTP